MKRARRSVRRIIIALLLIGIASMLSTPIQRYRAQRQRDADRQRLGRAERLWSQHTITSYQLHIAIQGEMVPIMYEVTVQQNQLMSCVRRAGLLAPNEIRPQAGPCMGPDSEPLTIAQLFQHAHRVLSDAAGSSCGPSSRWVVDVQFDEDYGFPRKIMSECSKSFDSGRTLIVEHFAPLP